jgi:tRNA pseudouridine55 synthase
MSRRRRGRDVHGVVLLDKPAGPSSNQALQKVRRLFDARKAGHTGNLDPFATGMLPICLGEASKTAAFMLDADKTYLATAHLGAATDTGDTEGRVTREAPVPALDIAAIEAAMATLTGEIDQVPPMYSALKRDGRPLYELARQGLEVERPPRRVTIHRLELRGWSPPRLEFEVCCSKGTYVRVLAEDLAERLGTCAHLVALRRTGVAPFEGRDMVTLAQLERAADEGALENFLLPPDIGLGSWPKALLDDARGERFRHGNPVPTDLAAGEVRVYGPGGKLLGLGEIDAGGRLSPRRVFNLS